MRIYSKGDDMSACESCYGNSYFELTREDVMALLDGKILADTDDEAEYGTFIYMKEDEL